MYYKPASKPVFLCLAVWKTVRKATTKLLGLLKKQIMPAYVEIRCIHTAQNVTIPNRILGIGGLTAEGHIWTLSLEAAIEKIKSRENRFFIRHNNRQVNVWITNSPEGKFYLRTVLDTAANHLLLTLPEGP
ncbi:hypothetical protein FK004_02845 [Flavobacterium kingsejongi]|uniref:DUF3892 domain-containing protein n=2 Tax=Flavobacterium kingsejongi TaxID=1678728 RepID=A0A2S1LKE6_9FLAO|nr:hypothetical protein FK004_02845 [Flavobacterium kingsejongi]